MRAVRRLSTVGLLIVALGALLGGAARRAPVAQDDGGQETRCRHPRAGFVDVIKVDGLLDPILVDFIEESIAEADRDGARCVGPADQQHGLGGVGRTIAASWSSACAPQPVPVAVWVGPSGSNLTGRRPT